MKSFFALISFVLMIFFAVVTAADKSGICTLPEESGPCRALVPSYFYNFEANECQEFTYGGCGGNGNRFKTKEECEKMCKEAA